jgi:transposase
MARLRQNDRERAVGMVQPGMTHQAVADHSNVSRITMLRLMISLRQTGRTNDRPRNDMPRVTSQRQIRHLRLFHLRNSMITAEDTARRIPGLVNFRISGQTVRRRLRKSGLRARHPVVGPIIYKHYRTARLACARARRRCRLHTWRHILFSDESRFSLRLIDGRYRVYLRRGEHFTDQCVYAFDRFGGGSVIVWGGISVSQMTMNMFHLS